jgi:hypothetical protein
MSAAISTTTVPSVPVVSITYASTLIDAVFSLPPFQRALEETTKYLLAANFDQAAALMQSLTGSIADKAVAYCLDQVLANPQFRERLRLSACEQGFSFHSNQRIHVQMPNGHHELVNSPWFENADQTGRRKVGPKVAGSSRKGRHLGLDVMGFFGKVCPTLASKAMVMGTLCPSIAIASSLLADEGICLSQNKIRNMLTTFDDLEPETRVKLSCEVGETFANKRIVIAADGGRFRERVTKKGRIPDAAKRRGFDTPWREPKLFTLFVIDEKGAIDKDVPILADGTTGDNDEALEKALSLLRAYFEHLNIAQAKEVTLLGDGAKWIWKRIPALLAQLGLPKERLIETIDYYHARENLHRMLDKVHYSVSNPRDIVEKKMTNFLYQGNIPEMRKLLFKQNAPGRKRKLKDDFTSYFEKNASRFRYAELRDTHPIGSGCVESAIRRVINLRIKSPGIFWKEAKAETMIFLRGKLLYRRWPTLMRNWLHECRRSFQPPTEALIL